MREILFRAKAINRIKGREYRTHYKNGDWVFGLLSKPYYDFNGYIQNAEMTNTDGVEGIEVDHETLGEFTGLTDCNEAKIFEGDIVQYIDNSGKLLGIVRFGAYEDCDEDMPYHRGFFIKWINSLMRYELGYWVFKREIEVIGNVYDNPELVGGGKE